MAQRLGIVVSDDTKNEAARHLGDEVGRPVGIKNRLSESEIASTQLTRAVFVVASSGAEWQTKSGWLLVRSTNLHALRWALQGGC